MAKEFVERETLLNVIRNNVAPMYYKDCLRYIVEAPTADVVEVVRCKDCSRYKQNRPEFGWCSVCNFIRIDNDFCSDGESVKMGLGKEKKK